MANLAPISELLKRATDAGDVPGVAAGVATSDGVIFEAAHGKRDLAGTAMTKDAIFRIASMTKAVTGACAMQMVEQGKLDLDSPIAKVLPELAEPKVLEGYDEAGKPKFRAATRPITLRQLLTHTSGHVYEIWNPKLAEYRQKSGTPSNGSGLLASLNSPLMFDPGERWEYSIGIDWAGRAVEEASGLKLADYMTRNLLGPLGMLDTGFRINDHQKQRLVQLFMREFRGLEAVRAQSTAECGIRCRRRRALLDDPRLSEVHPDDPEQGQAQWRSGAEGGDCHADGPECDG